MEEEAGEIGAVGVAKPPKKKTTWHHFLRHRARPGTTTSHSSLANPKTKPRKEKEEEEEEGAPKPPDVAGVARAEDAAPINHVDAAARHGTASTQHGHDPPLHHHPYAFDTNGEPLVLPCSPPDHAASAMALYTESA